MASHAIFQYNVLAINDTHNTWTNMIVKMTILRLLGSSDDKEKTDDGKDTLKIIVRNPRLGGQGRSPPENRSADQAQPVRPVSPTGPAGQTGSSS